MSTNTTSSQINSKRQQFRNQIRRKELDDYRRRKRQQYFGYVQGAKKSCIQSEHGFMQKVPKEFQQLVTESPFAFSMEFKASFVKQFEARLKENRFSIEAMNYVLDELVKLNFGELANSDKFSDKSMFSVLRILNTMMNKVCEIPKNSILRKDKHQLIEQIHQKVFYSLKTILIGMISQQQLQQSELRKYQNRLKLHQTLKNKQMTSMQQSKRQTTLENLQQLLQSPPSTKHPLQSCIKQVSELLQSFCTLYYETYLQFNENPSTLLGDTLSCYMQYYSTLWYLMSFMRSSLFSQQLFAFYHGQLKTFREFSHDMIDLMINTISNFIFNGSEPHSNNQQGINYDFKLIQASFAIFEGCLSAYDFSSTTLVTLVKTMTHAVIRQKAFCQLILKSTIFESCITIVRDSQQKLLNLAKQHVTKKTPHAVFQKQAQKINLLSIQRYQIYEFLGALFSSIELQDLSSIKIVRQHSQKLLQMIYFEYNKIMLNEVKDKALVAAIELESPEEKQRVILAVLYLQFNLFSFNPEIIQTFIEQNVLMYIMGIWQHFSLLEESFLKHSNVINVIERLHSIKKIQYSIISAVWNILVQFQFPEQQQLQREDPSKFKDRSQALQVITEFKQFGLVKMLVNYLKTVVYDTESMNINKDTVKFALHSLRRFFKFILFSSSQEHLCQCLSQSSTQVSTVKQVLQRMMNSEHVFEEELTNKALKCLEMFQVIVQNANFNEEYECYERGYNEQQYGDGNSGNWNNYGSGNWDNSHRNQQNQQNQGNWQNSYNQGNQSNWSNNQNNQLWNQNLSDDIEI